jgi:pimeloyl-ACP methyl ester carboxylesterase/DNA-binding CsgD family transcriptional regulator
MEGPLVQYATTVDGFSVAYWTLGAGPPLVQLPALPYSHIGVEWEQSQLRRTYELLASRLRLVRYDGRGMGLSQREVEVFSLETMLADLDAVVKALDGPQVALLGVINSSAVAIAYAARCPERVSQLVLWCPVVDGSVHLDNPNLQALRGVLETNWEVYTQLAAHALLGWAESEAALQFAEYIRAGITQDAARALVPEILKLNVWDDLPRVRCPTLVLHRPQLDLFPAGLMERVAASIPNAQLALLEGNSTVPWLGDWRALPRTVYSFLGLTLEAQVEVDLEEPIDTALTNRESEVLARVASGLSNKEIAQQLSLSVHTVQRHVANIYSKIGARGRADATAYALKHRLL